MGNSAAIFRAPLGVTFKMFIPYVIFFSTLYFIKFNGNIYTYIVCCIAQLVESLCPGSNP